MEQWCGRKRDWLRLVLLVSGYQCPLRESGYGRGTWYFRKQEDPLEEFPLLVLFLSGSGALHLK